MCDKELLVAYLYDELTGAERARMEAHLGGCAACRDELTGLRVVRTDLTTWAPPEPDLGFRIVRDRPAALSAGWRARLTPAFGLAAAATLVLAASAAVANVQVHYGGDGVTVRTGWARAAQPSSSPAPLQTASSTAIDAAAAQAIERRIADLEQFEKTAQTLPARQPTVMSASANRISDAELMKRFRELVAESENRQQTLLARQIQQLTFDTDRKRATDMQRVLQAINYIDSKTASDAAQHRQLADMVYRVAQQK